MASVMHARQELGRLPEICVLCSSGLILVAVADTAARMDLPFAAALFWMGLGLVLVPAALRICHPTISNRESLGIALCMGMSFYIVKVLHSPLYFTFLDEFYHWRGVIDIVDTHALFKMNVLLPAASSYPGIAESGAVLVQVAKMPPFIAGVLLIAVARFIMTWSLYSLFRLISGSAPIAGMASIVYMCNPNYLYFQSQFAYESLALPLAVLAISFLAHSQDEGRRIFSGSVVLGTFAALAVVLTHHLTAVAMLLFLFIWAVLIWLTGRNLRLALPVLGPVLLSVLVFVLWTSLIATRTFGYLQPVFETAGRDMVRTIANPSQPNNAVRTSGSSSDSPAPGLPGRSLFQDFTGEVAPFIERVLGLASIVLVLLTLPIGIRRVWSTHRRNAIALTCALGTMLYPCMLAFRLTPFGAEILTRSSEFLFIALAIVLSLGLQHNWLDRLNRPMGSSVAILWLGILFSGGVILGWPRWARMPGSYQVSANSRSVESQGIEAAKWTLHRLGPDNRLAADRIQIRLMSTFGHQRPVTRHTDRINIAELMFARKLGDAQREIVALGAIKYVVLDRRILDGLPRDGVYFQEGEPNWRARRQPMDSKAVDKFDSVPGVSRIYDSGAIRMYNVEALQSDR
jgi:hypothetical protein